GSYVVKVNNRKVLDGMMDAANIASEKRLTVLRAIDKADKFSLDEVKKLLGEGRKDESGDFTKGAGLDERQSEIVLSLLKSDAAASAKARLNETGKAGFDELAQIRDLVRASGYDDDRIRIDPSVVRGLEYYTGPVYEVELLLETTDEKGRPVRFGSVGGGGRYDGLVS
uniref:ATP phosphoribosyltransferase regulatory subunit n=1 Tax=Shinella sp. TaxID=1870904 RepID=UPI003F7288D6